MALELRCTDCGGPMPPLTMDDVERQMASSRGVELICPTCSGAAAKSAEPAGRHFQLEVSLVEVLPPTDGERDGSRELLMDWRVPATAPSLATALQPLVDGFAERWRQAQKAAHIADSPGASRD